MATTINVKSTVAQAEGFALELDERVLLATRYFPSSDADNFAGKEVLFDFESADLERGAFLTQGYKNGQTVNWIANSVLPPRVGISDSVDPTDQDRMLFERLCRAQGVDVDRNQAYQDLLVLKATRLSNRAYKSIESICAPIIKTGRIEFEQMHDENSSAGDADNSPVCIRYYDPEKGADNHFVVKKKWSDASATPYQDVCDMLTEGRKRGVIYTDLLMGATAWANICNDEAFKKFYTAIHTENALWTAGDIDGAEYCGTGIFNGMKLNLIVYSGAYKNSSGNMETYLGENDVIVINPACGRGLQGGVTLLNPSSIGYDLSNAFMGARGRIIASIYKDFNNQKIEVRVESRPCPAPKQSINSLPWIYCDTGVEVSGGHFGVSFPGVSFKVVKLSDDSEMTVSTKPSCAADVAVGGSSVTITPAANSSDTFKYYSAGKELALTSNSLAMPKDGDFDADGKLLVTVVDQNA